MAVDMPATFGGSVDGALPSDEPRGRFEGDPSIRGLSARARAGSGAASTHPLVVGRYRRGASAAGPPSTSGAASAAAASTSGAASAAAASTSAPRLPPPPHSGAASAPPRPRPRPRVCRRRSSRLRLDLGQPRPPAARAGAAASGRSGSTSGTSTCQRRASGGAAASPALRGFGRLPARPRHLDPRHYLAHPGASTPGGLDPRHAAASAGNRQAATRGLGWRSAMPGCPRLVGEFPRRQRRRSLGARPRRGPPVAALEPRRRHVDAATQSPGHRRASRTRADHEDSEARRKNPPLSRAERPTAASNAGRRRRTANAKKMDAGSRPPRPKPALGADEVDGPPGQPQEALVGRQRARRRAGRDDRGDDEQEEPRCRGCPVRRGARAGCRRRGGRTRRGGSATPTRG